ncbi:hypothetical protein AA0Y32_08580 [Georgenia phoenicis]|uniref:hypothetical protein n=1 Tax=unclassified Georgenia TaxID=2626815 RepID=UPI0039B07613
MLQATVGTPDPGMIFLFATGAVLSFTLLEAVLSRGFRRPMPQHRSHVLAVGTSLNIVSVLGGLGATWLLGTLMSHAAVWALAPFAAGVVYLLLESLETALGERVLAAAGAEDADDVEP